MIFATKIYLLTKRQSSVITAIFMSMKCNDISASEYKELENEHDDVPWFCKKCTTEMFPFGSLAND